MNLISLLNRAFKEPGDTPRVLVATTSIANTCPRSGARRKNCSEGRKEGRKMVKRRKDDSEGSGWQETRRTKRPKEPGITEATGRKHDNTITRGHNEFIAGNLRTINAELLTYCFASSWVASENGRWSRLFSIPRREGWPPRNLLFASSGWKRGKREGRRGTVVVFYRGASYYGANRAPFARQASTGAVIYPTFLAFLVYEAH